MARHRHELTDREQWQRLERWLCWLPAEVVDVDPELLVLKAWLQVNRFRHGEVSATVERAEACFDESPGDPVAERLRAEIDALHSFRCFTQYCRGDLAVEHAERALDKKVEGDAE